MRIIALGITALDPVFGRNNAYIIIIDEPGLTCNRSPEKAPV